MRFNVALIDPAGERYAHFMFDMARSVLCSLESLGYHCTLERNRCDPEAMNVLVGSHLLASPAEAASLLGGATDYVVLQTEILSARTINGADAADRMTAVTLPLLRGARAVWDCLEVSRAALAECGIRTELFRFGHHERMEEIVHKPERDIDFLFYGSLSPWRRETLERLDALGYRVRADFDSAAVFRNDLIARAEIVLTLRHGREMTHLPQARIVYAVTNRCLVVGEGGAEQESLEDTFVWTNEPKDLVELCRVTRARRDRHELASRLYENLRSRPMSGLIAPLVAKLSDPTPHGARVEPAA